MVNNSNYFIEPDLTDYTFQYETSLGVKRYVKYINGIPTNDYYDIQYDEDGNVIYFFKSSTTINDESKKEISLLTTKFASTYKLKTKRIVIDEGMEFNILNESNIYDCIVNYHGKLIPVRFFVNEYSNKKGFTYLEIQAINLLDNTLLPEDILWEGN